MRTTVLLRIFLWLTCISCINSTLVRFYENADKSGSPYTSRNFHNCTNIQGKNRPQIASLETDTCVIVYGYPDCKGSWTKKFLPSYYTTFPNGWLWRIGSFHACNDEEGGPKLNVDITKYFEEDRDEIPELLERYRDVCSCVNVPINIQQMRRWSINNHANDLYAYFEPNCSETKSQARFIPAGHDADSREMNHYKQSPSDRVTKILSFGPDFNSTYYTTSCTSRNLNAKTGSIKMVSEIVNQEHSRCNESLRYLKKLEVELASNFSSVERKFKTYDIKLVEFMYSQNDKFEKLAEEFRDLERQVKNKERV